ncbi:sodium/potassium/calcium exchanger [Plakobranchus ocellatus]|uniref:Sodium/potassium/calcium exchanger n=1 Tax=Plakobranchus ocellatus TaxID=259542 RepID=A0AAV4BAH5_9GAST|nr:sodium/potassium/calcium exchanger [Plakobranchus ocellatus]
MIGKGTFRSRVFIVWASALTLGLRGAGYLFDFADPSDISSTHVDSADLLTDRIPAEYSTANHGVSRHLLYMPNCTPRAVEQFPKDIFSQKERIEGAIVLHVICVIYMFLALAIVCDNYFVPALEVLCDMLHLQTDVAGATFMAAGSSAPELATAVIGVFIAKDDVGLSTVVGSAIYNVMFVVSVCGLAARSAVQLSWWPLIRDCLAYLVSIVALVVVIMDEVIRWYESIIFLALYVLYIVFMFFNQPLEKYFVQRLRCFPAEASSVPDQVVVHYEKMNSESNGNGAVSESSVHLTKDGRAQSLESVSSNSDESATEIHKAAPEENPWHPPRGRCAYFIWFMSLPLNALMFITIPDCRRDSMRKWFLVTFLMSLVWLSLFSFLMVWMITIIGFTVNIPDSVMSLTFVAFGVSLPDVVASVLVIKDGLGDMAVSNAVGSNVFDILVCLGIPWFLQTCVLSPGSTILVYSEGLLYSSITLLSTVAILVLGIHFNKWLLDKCISIFFMFVYIAYSVLASMYELNVFGYFHPEECPSDY